MAHDETSSWSQRFADAFDSPESQKSRTQITRDTWAQLRLEVKKRREIESSDWWRVTRPARRTTARVKRGRQPQGTTDQPRGRILAGREAAIARRTNTVLAKLDFQATRDDSFETALTGLGSAFEPSPTSRELMWFAFLAVVGRYPSEDDLLLLESDVQVYGARHAIDGLLTKNVGRSDSWSVNAGIQFVENAMVDVSLTATIDAHTGIQRVVRETFSR